MCLNMSVDLYLRIFYSSIFRIAFIGQLKFLKKKIKVKFPYCEIFSYRVLMENTFREFIKPFQYYVGLV